eukprot:GDKI01013861.1.p1 GENE.GDKI01013861.1~~GDKI01013861.1.p1  ORF type:complete len:151 (+),score=39.36 GDKI01013861.1:67-519(+)
MRNSLVFCLLSLLIFTFQINAIRPNANMWEEYTAVLQAENKENKEEDVSLEKLLSTSTTPVLVDFFASWCGPCRLLAPELQELADATEGRLVIAKLDVDKEPEMSEMYGVAALPTMVLFVDGKPMHRLEGYLRAPRILEKIEKFLPGGNK